MVPIDKFNVDTENMQLLTGKVGKVSNFYSG